MHLENKFEAGSQDIMNFEVSIHFFCPRGKTNLIFKVGCCAQDVQSNKGQVGRELLIINSLSMLPFIFKYAILLI